MHQLTRREILEETFRYYEEDPSRRAINKVGGCEYLTPDGRKCAVGKWINWKKVADLALTADSLNEYGNFYDMDTSLFENYRLHAEEILLKEAENIPREMWSDLQNYHDNDQYWHPGGEKKRQEYKEQLLEKWAEKEEVC